MKWFDNLRIRNKILLTNGLIIAILLLNALAMYINSGKIQANSEKVIEDFEISNFLETSIANQNNWSKDLLHSIVGNSGFSGEVDPRKCSFGKWFYAAQPPEGFSKDQWEKLEENHRHLHESAVKINALVSQGYDLNEIITYYERETEQLLKDVNDDIQKLSTIIKEDVNKSSDEMQSTFTITARIILVITFFSIIVAFLLSLYTANKINKPVQLLKERIQRLMNEYLTNIEEGLNSVATGNLNVKIEKTLKPHGDFNNDELGQLTKNVDQMIEKFNSGIDSYETVRERIGALSSETNKLLKNSKEGLLDLRGNEKQFEGAYKEIIHGMNEMLDEILEPIMNGINALEKMSAGDLTARVKTEYKNDHKKMIDSINKLGESLEKVISDVTEAVQATANASSEISSSSEEMAAGAQEQSAQANEVASAVKQMTSTILETTQNTSQASSKAQSNGNVAQEGGKAVEDTINGMNRIAEVVTKAASTVKNLGKSSDKIGEIVQVIDDIADQTNLLALNAAIEAARAGEQGRGFAVVADEVRKLAERTTKATKEIAAMISTIQTETSGAVESMDEGTVEVENGKELALKAGESLKKIVGSTEEVRDLINQVATASEEQSSAAEQISKNIETITSVTQQSAAGIQQIARAAEDLNKLTYNLENIITQFKTSSMQSVGVIEQKQNDMHSIQKKPTDSHGGNGKGNGRLVYN